MSLATFYPKPQSLRVAGIDVLAREWRVGHAASVDHWLAGLPHPLADLDPSSSGYPDRLRVAFESDWPPRLGDKTRSSRLGLAGGLSTGDRLLFGTAEGRAEFLRVTLRASDATILGSLPGIADAMGPGEWRSLKRIAFGVEEDVRAEAGKLIDEHLGIGPYEVARHDSEALLDLYLSVDKKQRVVTWPEEWSGKVAKACVEFRMTPAEVRCLYLGQFRMMMSPDKGRSRWRFREPADRKLAQEVDAKRRAFWGGDASGVGLAPTNDSPFGLPGT